ncbi:MAG: heat-inducible transcriptional repressor HrcA, partial [Oscillospiraceae bacterium]
TIRNDMAMLEQLGYLEQPHTSAGRIPTYNGFRLYIDKLMPNQPLSNEEKTKLDKMLDTSNPTEEALMQSATKALAELTKCAAAVVNVSPQYSVISKVEVIPTGKRLYVLLLITSSGNIKNKVCRLEFDLTNEQLDFFASFMKENLQGVQLDTFSDEMVQQLILAMGTYMMTLTPLIQAVYDLTKDMMTKEISMTGEGNLLSCKDFDQTEIIRFLENKNEVSSLLDDSFSGLQVMFSQENDSFIINNSSVIMSQVHKDGKNAGSLGVIGPMRLDYAKIIPYIEYFAEKISDIITDDDDNNSTGKDTD